MFFGGGKGPESVDLEGLAELLVENFNRKLSGLDSRASRAVKGIDDAKVALAEACHEFRELKKDPDTEYLRTNSVAYVMDQKDAYTTLLSRIITAAARPEADYATIYERYYAEIQRTGALLSEIMKANAKFKMVLDAYPNDLNRFKRSYAAIETQWRMLKSDLDARNAEANEYHEILGYVNDLRALSDELQVCTESVREFEKSPPRKVEEAEIAKVRERATSVREEVKSLERRIAESSAEVSVILSTLDKPVRKHDYLSLYKPKLTPFLDDHAGLREPERYDNFYKQMMELRQEVADGKIAVKNQEEVTKAIGRVLDGTLRKLLDGIAEAESGKSHLDAEFKELQKVEKELTEILNGTSKKAASLGEIKARIEEIAAERKEKREAIERLLQNYYRKQVSVRI